MATIALIVGAAASAYGAYSTAQSQKKASQAAGAGAKGLTREATGAKPMAARYTPIDFGEEQLAAVTQNWDNLSEIQQLVRGTNEYMTQDDLNRASRLIPGYKDMMRLQGRNGRSLLGGSLPYEDVLGIVANRAEGTGAFGLPGGDPGATLRDLGLSRLDAIKAGGGIMKDMVGIAETISPISRRSKATDFFVDPKDRIRLAMEQNQLIQQSDQNAFNLEAGADPLEQARAMASIANPQTAEYDPTADYIQAGVQALGTLGSAYSGASAQGKFGMSGLDSSTGFYRTPQAASRAYGAPGYNPRILQNAPGQYYSIPA